MAPPTAQPREKGPAGRYYVCGEMAGRMGLTLHAAAVSPSRLRRLGVVYNFPQGTWNLNPEVARSGRW